MARRLAWLSWIVLASLAVPASAQRVEPSAVSLRARIEGLRAGGACDEDTLLGLETMVGLEGQPRVRDASSWLDRASTYLDAAEEGRDPYLSVARGQISLRAYRSPISEIPQSYAIYVPADYDPARRYPLLVALHGGSSNGNLFCALTLGARVPWADYPRHLWAVHEPQLAPSWIVVAPNGFGNSLWRFMGERDVLDVIDDVARHYSVDADRIVLHGLSNGGLGAFNIGMRFAWRFSAVVPLSGAPGWAHYLRGRPGERDMRLLRPLSAWSLIENARGTHLHAHHGFSDPGPMRPGYLRALEQHTDALGVPFALDWYATGHDLVGPVHRADRVFDHELERRRDRSPSRVTLVTADYRAARQHWVEVTRIAGYPAMVHVEAERAGDTILVTTEGPVRGLALHDVGARAVEIDGSRIAGGRDADVRHFVRRSRTWRAGHPVLEGKRPGLAGPLSDAMFDRMIHVYGTRTERSEVLREAAERGARGWIDNLRGVRQTVVADTELTPELMASGHLVLYGSPADNEVLGRIAGQLPIHIEPGGIRVGQRLYRGRHLGVRFIHPNPLHPDRYVVVQGSARPETVRSGHALAVFLPDWVVYDARRLPPSARNLPTGTSRHVASGFFDDQWRLSGPDASPERPRPLASR